MAHGSFHNVKAVLDMLPPNLQDARILDVGFGCGQVSHTIMAFSGRDHVKFKGEPYIIGLDLNPVNVDLAKKWMPFYREVYLYDVTDIPYPKNIIENLDIIICTEVVEHTRDKEKTLKMIEYLRDKAKLVIFTCPNGNNLTRPIPNEVFEGHNTIWYETDFRKLGYNTVPIKRIYWGGYEYEIISLAMKFLNILKPYNKIIVETIFAWRDNTK